MRAHVNNQNQQVRLSSRADPALRVRTAQPPHATADRRRAARAPGVQCAVAQALANSSGRMLVTGASHDATTRIEVCMYVVHVERSDQRAAEDTVYSICAVHVLAGRMRCTLALDWARDQLAGKRDHEGRSRAGRVIAVWRR